MPSVVPASGKQTRNPRNKQLSRFSEASSPNFGDGSASMYKAKSNWRRCSTSTSGVHICVHIPIHTHVKMHTHMHSTHTSMHQKLLYLLRSFIKIIIENKMPLNKYYHHTRTVKILKESRRQKRACVCLCVIINTNPIITWYYLSFDEQTCISRSLDWLCLWLSMSPTWLPTHLLPSCLDLNTPFLAQSNFYHLVSTVDYILTPKPNSPTTCHLQHQYLYLLCSFVLCI